jgi:hypothetical protein
MIRWFALSVAVLFPRGAAAANSLKVEVDAEHLKYRACLHLAEATEYDATALVPFASGPTPHSACVQVRDDLGRPIQSVNANAGKEWWCPSGFVSQLYWPSFVKRPQSGEVCGQWLDVAKVLVLFAENSKTMSAQWATLRIGYRVSLRSGKEEFSLKEESPWVTINPAARPLLTP